MEQKTCEITGQRFEIPSEEVDAYKSFGIPIPTICPEERFRRLMAFRNEEQFFWRKCDATGKKIYSVYPQNSPFPVVVPDHWWSNAWDPISYGQELSLKRPFTEQLLELWWKVPRPAYIARESENSAAVHNVRQVRSSFVLFNAENCNNCYHSVGAWNCTYCADCYHVHHCDRLYECIHCHYSKNLRWSEFCNGCEDSWFLSNCTDCKNCLFCTNLNGKQYYILNQPVSPEEFEQVLVQWAFTARPRVELAKEQFEAFLKDKPLPHIISDSPADNTGNYLLRCTSARNSYECADCDTIFHCHALHDARFCVDGYGFGRGLTEAAQFVSCGDSAKALLNCIECWHGVADLTYCTYCEESSNLFGCVGLRGKEYCIFNKQYSKAGYFENVKLIIEQLVETRVWGKFLSPQFSGYSYNHSSANKYMQLSRVTAKLMGYRWDERDEVIRPSQLLGTAFSQGGDVENSVEERFSEVPARLEEVNVSGLGTALFLCELTGKPFTIVKEEYQLYAALGVAPPARSFEQRHHERLMRLAPKRLLVRTTPEGEEFKTAFPAGWRRPVLYYPQWKQQIG